MVYAENHLTDLRLPSWRKSVVPILSLPPPGIKLSGWRDPYIVGSSVKHPEHGWTMLMGSGIKNQGGTVLVYRGNRLDDGETPILQHSCERLWYNLVLTCADVFHKMQWLQLVVHTCISVIEHMLCLHIRMYNFETCPNHLLLCAGWLLAGELCSGHEKDGMGTGIVWVSICAVN